MNIARAARRFTAIMDRHGVSVSRSSSALSESVYLTCSTEAETIRVRGSNHTAKPTYELLNGYADVEFGDHDLAESDLLKAVTLALAGLSMDPDAALLALIDRRDRMVASARARMDARVAEMRARREAAEDALVAECIKRYPVYADYLQRSDKGAKNKRRLIRRKVEAELAAEAV